ncbi:hypothetical protein GE321_00795 [Shigella sonnei]|nr:hypothetical protein [Shigella sonnei]
MSRELMPKSGIMMPHVVVTRDAAVVGVSTVDGAAGAINLTEKYLQKSDAEAIYQTKAEGATKQYVTDAINPIMTNALFKDDPFVNNDTPIRSGGGNGVESVDMIKVTPENTIKLGSYASSVQGVEIHSAGRLQVVDQNDSGVETKYPVYSKRYRPEVEDLPFASIGSYVKDSKGRTIGVTRTGINSDIKQLTQKVTFTQPVTIPDAVGDYDAVTLRQLRNSGGGSGGPTMSGISNFGIGDFHLRDSRAFIPAFEVTSDGQLLNRADYPDLWAYAQLLSPIEDSLWLGSTAQRGKYSNGDGSTTFRVPDRNGVQSGSVPGLFGRGDGGDSALNGIVRSNAAPNITGSMGTTISTLYDTANTTGTGAIVPAPVVVPGFKVDTGGTTNLNYRDGLDIDASLSNPAYGRDGTAEVRPNAFTGVWTIRAHGGFTAANTSWSVINSDASVTPDVYAKGGLISSEYKVSGVVRGSATFQSSYRLMNDGKSEAFGDIDVKTSEGGLGHYSFNEKGRLQITNSGPDAAGTSVSLKGVNRGWNDIQLDPGYSRETTGGGINVISDNQVRDKITTGVNIFSSIDTGYPTKTGFGAYSPGSDDFAKGLIYVSGDGGFFSRYFFDHFGQINGTNRDGQFSYTKNGPSDERIKREIRDISPEKAISVIKGLNFKSFIYTNDEQERVRRGVIAQQAEKVEPLYVKTRKYPGMKEGDPEIEQKELDTTPMLLDTMQVVQDLLKRIEVLESKLAEK